MYAKIFDYNKTLYVKWNIEECSRNNCGRAKTINITLMFIGPFIILKVE